MQIRGPLAKLNPDRQDQPRLQDDEALKEAAKQASRAMEALPEAASPPGCRGAALWTRGQGRSAGLGALRKGIGARHIQLGARAGVVWQVAAPCIAASLMRQAHTAYQMLCSCSFECLQLQVEQQLAVTTGKHDNWGDMYAGEPGTSLCGLAGCAFACTSWVGACPSVQAHHSGPPAPLPTLALACLSRPAAYGRLLLILEQHV